MSAELDPAVFVPDALDGHGGKGQVPLAPQAGGTEGRQALAQGDNPPLQLTVNLVGAVVGSAGAFLQTLQPLRQVAAPPLAHGGDGRAEGPRGSLKAVLTGVIH